MIINLEKFKNLLNFFLQFNSWLSDGVPVSISLTNVTTETPVLRPTNNTLTSQVSLLRLRTTSSMNGKIITCQATNHALQQSVHDAITLNIHCKYI